MVMKMKPESFAVLAEPSRCKIIELLSERAYCVSAIAAKLNLSAPAVSQHLKVLREADWVEGVKYGYHTHYKLNREQFKELADYIAGLSAERPRVCRTSGYACDVSEEVGCRRQKNEEQENKEENTTSC